MRTIKLIAHYSSAKTEKLRLSQWLFMSSMQIILKKKKIFVGEEKNVYVPPIDYYISPAEVLVVTSIRYCVYREHTLIKGTASVNVLKNGAVKEATLPVL